MRKLKIGLTALCALGLLSAGGAAFGGSFSFEAYDISQISGLFDPTGVNATHRTSIMNETTYGNFETPYDFFFQPWELPQIAFPQTWHLGNRHEEGEEGDYKGIYWSQLANNAKSIDFFGSSSSLDVLTAAYLANLGGGRLGVSAAWGSTEESGSDSFVNGGSSSSSFEDKASLAELYVTYGRRAGSIDWGVALTITSLSLETDSRNSGGFFFTEEADLTNWNLLGGVKFKMWDNDTFNVFISVGKPNFENTERDDSGDMGTFELDGMTWGLGGDYNHYFASWDLELWLKYWQTSYDPTDRFVQGGTGMVFNSFTGGDVDDSKIDFFARGSYVLGRAHIFKGFRVLSGTIDTELTDSFMGTVDIGQYEEELILWEPNVAIKFPLTCRECWLSVNLIAGAAYTWAEIEQTFTDSSAGSGGGFQSTDTFTDSGGSTSYRMGMEIRGERWVFEAGFQQGSSSESFSPSETADGSGGGFFKGFAPPIFSDSSPSQQSSRDSVDLSVWSASISFMF